MTLQELRRELRPRGYKVSTKRLSWGRHLTYAHVDSGEKLTGNVFTTEQLKIWQPLFDYLRTIPEDTLLVGDFERIYGAQFKGETKP